MGMLFLDIFHQPASEDGGTMQLSLRRKIVVCIFFILLLPLSVCSSNKQISGPQAPDFSLEDLSGKAVSLRQHRGQVVLIDFWATWCPPCRTSIPELVDLHRKYKERGLVVLGISLDDPRKVDNSSLAAFQREYKIEYSILRGDENVVRDYSGKDGMAIPTMVFVNREGQIVDKLVGFAPGRVETSIKKLLR
jgi:cytochrome c biogenesis protein CcmG/thiol:disulfide interchange protein DsbE